MANNIEKLINEKLELEENLKKLSEDYHVLKLINNEFNEYKINIERDNNALLKDSNYQSLICDINNIIFSNTKIISDNICEYKQCISRNVDDLKEKINYINKNIKITESDGDI